MKRKPPLLADRRPRELTLNPFGPTERLGPLFERLRLTPEVSFFVLR